MDITYEVLDAVLVEYTKYFDIYHPNFVKVPSMLHGYFSARDVCTVLRYGLPLLAQQENMLKITTSSMSPYGQECYTTFYDVRYLFAHTYHKLDFTEVTKLLDSDQVEKAIEYLQVHSQTLQTAYQNQQEMERKCVFPEINNAQEYGRLVVISDLHGSYYDMYNIFYQYDALNTLGTNTRFVFLGDYSDRGYFGIEIIIILISLMVRYPGRVFMLRGNHENRVCSKSFFNLHQEVSLKYGGADADTTEILELLEQFYSVLPLGAIVNGDILLTHANIPNCKALQQLDDIDRKVLNIDTDTVVGQMLNYDFANSSRKSVNQTAIKEFMSGNGLRYLIRGHEFQRSGATVVSYIAGCYAVLSLFSISNYGQYGRCCVVEMYNDGFYVRRIALY